MGPNKQQSNEDNEAQFPSPPHGTAVEPEIIGTDNSTDTEQDWVGSETVSLDDIDSSWTTYFPFDEPYADQVDGIDALIETLSDNGYMVMEGACGTGKTLVGLSAGIQCLRNRTEVQKQHGMDAARYDRLFVVTPVKQQLKQFIEEMRTINDRVEDAAPLKTVIMRGQNDVLPYAHVDYKPFDEYSAAQKIDDLRELTIELIKFDSNIPLKWPDEVDEPAWSHHDYDWSNPSDEASTSRDNNKFDPNRAKAVVTLLHKDVEDGADPLVVDGVESPYPDGIPTTDMVADLSKTATGQLALQLQGRFDPFYAGFFANDRLPFWFDSVDDLVLDSEQLFENGVKTGVCPHQAMAKLMQHADVLIGNYYHVFDPDTRLLTDMKTGVLDEDTICVFDEAHNIEEIVRDILSDSKGGRGLTWAANDIRAALGYLTDDPSALPQTELKNLNDKDTSAAREDAEGVLDSPAYGTLDPEDFRTVIDFLEFAEQWLKEAGHEFLEDKFDTGWQNIAENHRDMLGTETISLEEPESEEIDDFTQVVNREFGGDIWTRVYAVSQASEAILGDLGIVERTPQCGDAGLFFYRWENESGIDYFREIVLEYRPTDYPRDDNYRWTEEWHPQFQLYNCIPTRELRAVFSELGGGLLMSATLEPIDEFITTTGVGESIHPQSVEDKEERRGLVESGQVDVEEDIEFRDVAVKRYPMRFPKENRVSLSVTASKYTYSNRGSPTTNDSQMKNVRRTYANIITDLAKSQGNVLLAMPSYSEARWARDILADRGVTKSKPVVLDQSSTSDETDENLNRFFNGEDAVIITSTRGTITEGIDYDGEKLHTAAVIGVSLLPPTDRHKAVEKAYDEYLDEIDGFTATNKIPAARKARQAIGRVIRGNDEIGARVLVDERYTSDSWGGLKKYLSPQEKTEFTEVKPNAMKQRLDLFWESHN